MKKIQKIIIALLAIVVLMTVLAILGRGSGLGLKPKNLLGVLPPEIDMRLTNLILNEVGKKNQNLNLAAKTAKYFKAEDLLVLDEVKAQLQHGENLYYITALSGKYQQEKQLANLFGDVEVRDDQNRILKANALDYDMQTGLLSSKDPFELTGPKMDLSGTGFALSTEDYKLKVAGRVKLVVK